MYTCAPTIVHLTAHACHWHTVPCRLCTLPHQHDCAKVSTAHHTTCHSCTDQLYPTTPPLASATICDCTSHRSRICLQGHIQVSIQPAACAFPWCALTLTKMNTTLRLRLDLLPSLAHRTTVQHNLFLDSLGYLDAHWIMTRSISSIDYTKCWWTG